MSAKCGGCGKFLTGGANCYKCKGMFHIQCVNLTTIPKKWHCPGCVARTPRQDNTNTPVKVQGQQEVESPPSPQMQDGSLDTQRALLEEMRALRADMNSFRKEFSNFREEVRTEIKDLRVAHQATADRLDGFCERLDSQETRLDNQEAKIAVVCKETTELKTEITLLKRELQDRDQQALQNDLEISGVWEHKGESLIQILGLITSKVGVRLEERDIVSAHRAGPVHADQEGKQRPRPIAVRLARRVVRDEVLREVRARRGLTTADIEVEGAPRSFHVNERLSKENRALFRKARTVCKEHSWKYVWTREGNVLIREGDGGRAFRIREESDIDRCVNK